MDRRAQKTIEAKTTHTRNTDGRGNDKIKRQKHEIKREKIAVHDDDNLSAAATTNVKRTEKTTKMRQIYISIQWHTQHQILEYQAEQQRAQKKI